LFKPRKLALRRGVWFKILSRVERGVIDLTVKYVDAIKSITLAKLVTAILGKLQSAIETIMDKFVRTTGLSLTRKINNIAINWGNRSASMWADDLAARMFVPKLVSKVSYASGFAYSACVDCRLSRQ